MNSFGIRTMTPETLTDAEIMAEVARRGLWEIGPEELAATGARRNRAKSSNAFGQERKK